ncbi:MAG TPA: hypothetical protein VJW73_07800, partial [Gemmatimonadaceae bacterium]|nr:hypothetical protein [Gemmatimonadaceae bacterium]
DSIVTVPLDQFYHARQDPQRALKLLQTKSSADLLTVARALERARLAERLGQRDRAVEEYARVADLWRNADAPQLRDARDEARSALQRLDADGRLRGELTHR